MNIRVNSIVLLLLGSLMCVPAARADSLSVRYHFIANDGSGDNASSLIVGPGTSIATGGGTGCEWCFVGTFFNPGTTLNPSINYVGFGSFFFKGTFQGTTIDSNYFGVGSTTLTAGSFTFPPFVEGSTFTITVPASMGTINIFNGTQVFPFTVKPGQLRLTFAFGGQQYWFQSGLYTVTPEPQTLVLLASGVLAIAGAAALRRTFMRN